MSDNLPTDEELRIYPELHALRRVEYLAKRAFPYLEGGLAAQMRDAIEEVECARLESLPPPPPKDA